MLGWFIKVVLLRTVFRRFWWLGLLLFGIARLRGQDEQPAMRRA
jgi:hypothetical protein